MVDHSYAPRRARLKEATGGRVQGGDSARGRATSRGARRARPATATGQGCRRLIHESSRSMRMSDADPIETLAALTQPFVAKQLYESRTVLIMGEINSMVAE